MLPTFIVIGAMKAGTTGLYQQLRRHPQVFVSKTKEPNYFSDEDKWHLGVDWYEGLFDGARNAVARGEASIRYTAYPKRCDVPGRISAIVPDVRLIYLVRHPVDRMISHLWMDMRQGVPVGAPDETLLEQPRFVNVSRYSMQIERYLEYFPREQMLVVKSEDFRTKRARTLERVLGFIGVETALLPDDVDPEQNRGDADRRKRPIDRTLQQLPAYRLLANVTPEPVRRLKRRVMLRDSVPRPAVSPSTRIELEGRVRDDVRRLYRHIDPPFDGWGIA